MTGRAFTPTSVKGRKTRRRKRREIVAYERARLGGGIRRQFVRFDREARA